MKIQVCKWKTCSDRFSSYIIDRLNNDKSRFNLDKLEIEEVMCLWNCKCWPSVLFNWKLIWSMNPTKASDLVNKSKSTNNKK